MRPYQNQDEAQWLRCRVLAFLDTAYFDNVLQEKEHYAHPAIELVAEIDGEIVGLIDVECEDEPGVVCSPSLQTADSTKAGMIWNIAVHPDYRHQGIGKALLQAAIENARKSQIQRFEAWTRDDATTLKWYEAQGFQKIETYLHVYLQGDEAKGCSSNIPGLQLKHVFAYYSGTDTSQIGQLFRRVHQCNRYDLLLE
ncbi:MAG: GNAT family N-acetyltransferase [Leptolyngbya sp. SIO1D8]|nr:GNAT family N-acetyltransferase [Leptolyngbya sp. SIO1D8]